MSDPAADWPARTTPFFPPNVRALQHATASLQRQRSTTTETSQPVDQPGSRSRSTTAVKASGPIPSQRSSATGPRPRQQFVSSIDRGSDSQLADLARGFKPALSLSAQQQAGFPPKWTALRDAKARDLRHRNTEASLSKPASTSTGSAPYRDETQLLLLDVVHLPVSSDPSPFLSCLFSPLPPSPTPR